MTCLVRVLYYKASGKPLPCKKCPFWDDCDDERR